MIGIEKEGFPVKKLLAVFLVLALLLTGCSGVSEAIDDASIRPLAQALLDSFVADDLAGCRALLDENVSDEQLEAYFSAIHLELKDLGPYEMTAVSWNRNITDEEDLTSIRYLIEAENMKLYLMVSMFTGSDRLSGFKLEDAENTAEPTLPMGPVHWIFLAVGAAVLGFVIWMFVDCARRKMKRKWLWLPLILLIIKELFAGITGLMMVRRGIVIGADWHGKVTTALLYGTILVHMAWVTILPSVSNILIGACTAMMILSGILYGIRNLKCLRAREVKHDKN